MIKTTTLLTILAFALVPIYQSKPIYKPIEKDSILIGEWMITGFGNVDDKGRVLWGQCNACSLIRFYKNGQGVIIGAEGNGPTTYLAWSLKSSRLSFKFSGKKQRSGFIKGNLKYISSYCIKGNKKDIILLDTRQNFELMLTRTVD
ncbi:hypothetical protein [Mucilaginibacter sp.]|uniref:hypothetical protein n=1 Tax=Mucilaginibacter sp. TaxID=1882438 RepID=UPI00374D4E70